MTEKNAVLVTGASSGFGAMAVRELAGHGHIVFAGMFGNFPGAREDLAAYAREHTVDLRPVDIDITDERSVQLAVDFVYEQCGRLDTIVHNAGHMCVGPAEAFAPEQYLHLYDVNTVGPQRLNRAALPRMRKAGRGHLIWVSSSSARGAGSPYLAPYFAAKAAMDSLAQSYHLELTQWGIDTTIIVPGVQPKGTAHFQSAAQPANKAVAQEYEEGPYKGVMEEGGRVASELAADADPFNVARAIAKVANLPRGQRPFRYSGLDIDPSDDGAIEVNAMADKMRREWLRRLGQSFLLQTRLDA